MARSVDDLVLALDIIAGPDEAADGRAYRLNLPPARGEKLSDFRVLVIAEHPLLPTSAAVGASLDRLSKHLAAAGADVKREAPLLPDLGASARLYVKLLNAFVSAGMPDDQYQEMRSAAEKIPAADQSLVAELMRGALLSARELFRFDFARLGLQQQWRVLFQNFDVVVCPPAATPAFPHDHTEPQDDRKIAVDMSTNWSGPIPRRPAACRRLSFPSVSRTVCRSACRSSAPNTKTGRRSPSPGSSSANSAGSPPRRATHRA